VTNAGMLKAKVTRLTREQAEPLRQRLAKAGHPTLHELTDPTKHVWELTWLPKGQGYRIERTKFK